MTLQRWSLRALRVLRREKMPYTIGLKLELATAKIKSPFWIFWSRCWADSGSLKCLNNSRRKKNAF